MKKHLAIGGIAAALLTTGVAATAATSATASGDNDPQGRHSTSSEKKAVRVIKCDGGRSINLRTRIVNSPFTFTETGVPDQDQAVPGASLAANGPASGTDTMLVTFSAESQVTGGDASDWLGLEVHLDGVPISPFTPAGDVLAFTGEPSWNANSIQFCAPIKRGPHRFQVYANLHDSGADHSLNGWLDDYTVSFQRFE